MSRGVRRLIATVCVLVIALAVFAMLTGCRGDAGPNTPRPPSHPTNKPPGHPTRLPRPNR